MENMLNVKFCITFGNVFCLINKKAKGKDKEEVKRKKMEEIKENIKIRVSEREKYRKI
jgi:hypothetical protein